MENETLRLMKPCQIEATTGIVVDESPELDGKIELPVLCGAGHERAKCANFRYGYCDSDCVLGPC